MPTLLTVRSYLWFDFCNWFSYSCTMNTVYICKYSMR